MLLSIFNIILLFVKNLMLTHFQAKKILPGQTASNSVPMAQSDLLCPIDYSRICKIHYTVKPQRRAPAEISINPDLVNSSCVYDKSGASKFLPVTLHHHLYLISPPFLFGNLLLIQSYSIPFRV